MQKRSLTSLSLLWISFGECGEEKKILKFSKYYFENLRVQIFRDIYSSFNNLQGSQVTSNIDVQMPMPNQSETIFLSNNSFKQMILNKGKLTFNDELSSIRQQFHLQIFQVFVAVKMLKTDVSFSGKEIRRLAHRIFRLFVRQSIIPFVFPPFSGLLSFVN